jgi:DNA-directed RNA polymerase subunit E'/Rpb7
MQHTAIFQEQIALTPKDLRSQIDSIDAVLLKKIQGRLEGRCSRHGYVLNGTVKILSRSMGVLEKGRFTGSILFYVQAEGTVLNPPDGAVLEGRVIRKNKMGMYVDFEDAIRVIVPRDLHIGNMDYEAVELGETVSVEIKKSRFQVNDPYILSVGLFQKSVKKVPKPAEGAAPAAAPPPLQFASGPEAEEGGEGEEGEEGEEGGEEGGEEEEGAGEEEEGAGEEAAAPAAESKDEE